MKTPIIIYNDRLLDRLSILMKIGGITLWPYIILREAYKKDYYAIKLKKLINHESIHIKQQEELFVILFYIWYIVEFIIRLLFTFSTKKAYKNISFEKEAHENDIVYEYTKTRPRFNFLKYIF